MLILHEEFEQALSLERFARYLEWAGGDRERALCLYTLNTQVSEALYTPLQMLEVVLRNRIHAAMSEAHGERWFDTPGLLAVENQRHQLAKAIEDIEADRKLPTSGRIVAALSFSFWTAMLSPTYESAWQVFLHTIARRENGKGLPRKDLARPLTPIRTLRNRVAHHEPIIQWNLPQHYENILRITGWLSPAAATWCRAHSRFEQVYPAERIQLAMAAATARDMKSDE
jgi:hypothetical protein